MPSRLAVPILAILPILFPSLAVGADLLRLEELTIPARVPAGVSVPIAARFTVLEPVRDGWRVSAELTPVAGGKAFTVGPVKSLFGADTPVGTEKTVSLSVPVPADAPPGRYRVIVDHYDNPQGEWVHLRYVDRVGKLLGVVLGEIEVTVPLAPLPLPAPQRRLRPGEIHQVYECEDFQGMAGRGDDLGVAVGWTWYAWSNLSRCRAAVNNTGSGTIYQDLKPRLPSGTYKLFVRARTTFSTVRLALDEAACDTETLRADWNEVGTVRLTRPARRLSLEAARKIGEYIIIDSVYVTNDLSVQATRGLDPSRQFLPAAARAAKRGRTIYTAAYLRSLRTRQQQYPQLREQAAKAVAEGRRLAAYGDEQLWQVLADTSLKREYHVNELKGCPVCGPEIMKHGRYAWIIDPLERPYKVQCPSCKGTFPSNDFAKGEMAGGDYPDDGTGFRRGEDTYRFLGCYVHWAYRNHFLAYVQSLSQATVLAEDPKLAHKTAVLLLRAAQQYPNSEDRQQRAFKGAWGTDLGCITDTVWSSYEGRNYGQAYDAVWPYLDRDEELLKLARREIPEIRTPEDLRLYLEENLLRRVGQAYCDEVIQGNPGYHHKGMAWLLLALGDMDSGRFPTCPDLLEFLYYRVYGAMRYFGNLLGPDGSSFESPGYNSARLNMLEAMDVVDRFFASQPKLSRTRFPSLWHDPRFAAQFDYYTDYVLLDRWIPAIGDAGGETVIPKRGPPSLLSVVSPGVALQAWQRYRTPRLARLAYGHEDKPPSPSLYENLPLKELAAARAKAPAAIARATSLQDDYGLAILRSGQGEDSRALWLWYGRLLDHGHDDALSFGFAAKSLDLLPELGYPKSWDHAGRWEANSLVHNTLSIDGQGFPTGRERGHLRLLGKVPGFQVVEAEGSAPGGGPPRVRRLLALVDLGPRDCYVVDLIDAQGGSAHTLSYHGPQALATVEGVALAKQSGGTIAGEDVAYGGGPTPLAHMGDVERGRPPGRFTVDYALGDEEATHVRLHHFPEPDTDLALGTGRPPTNPEAYAVRFCLQTRTGAVPLAGRYLSLVEPYSTRPVITSAERTRAEAHEALRVSCGDTTDTVLLAPEAGPASADGVVFDGRAALVRSRRGAPVLVSAYAFRHLTVPGLEVRAAAPFVSGAITACDYTHRSVTVTGLPADPLLVGMPLRVSNELHSTMQVIAAVRAKGRATELTLTTTALRHEGVVAGVGDHSLRDGANSPWAFDAFLRGTRLVGETGRAQFVVAGAAGGWWSAPTGTLLNLVDAGSRTRAAALQAALADANGDGQAGFRLYDYGVGDRVELANWLRLERQADGAWRGARSPGVTVRQAR